MLLHNQIFLPEEKDNAERVPFHTLRPGQRHKHTPTGWVNIVFKRDDDSITVKREDGWLVTNRVGDFVWDKMVIKV